MNTLTKKRLIQLSDLGHALGVTSIGGSGLDLPCLLLLEGHLVHLLFHPPLSSQFFDCRLALPVEENTYVDKTKDITRVWKQMLWMQVQIQKRTSFPPMSRAAGVSIVEIPARPTSPSRTLFRRRRGRLRGRVPLTRWPLVPFRGRHLAFRSCPKSLWGQP